MEPSILTTVRLDKEDWEWVKKNDTNFRAVMKAGIRRLQEGPQIEILREQKRISDMELSRNARRKSLMNWIYYNMPETYEKAVAAVLREEGKED